MHGGTYPFCHMWLSQRLVSLEWDIGSPLNKKRQEFVDTSQKGVSCGKGTVPSHNSTHGMRNSLPVLHTLLPYHLCHFSKVTSSCDKSH